MAGFYNQHLFSAIDLIESYSFQQPFALFLKNYFKRDKKFGSRDRKNIAELCYGYMRLGKSAMDLTIKDQIIIGYYLTHPHDNGLLERFSPALLGSIHQSLESKLEITSQLFATFDVQSIFPFRQLLSSNLDDYLFGISHLQKPLFFIKIRNKQFANVANMLKDRGISFQTFGEETLGFEQHIHLDELFKIDEEVVVQDISSQQTITLLDEHAISGLSLWDACAGSGGKSILASDRFHFSSHYVSDIRSAILEELTKRLTNARLTVNDAFCVDLTNSLSIQVAKSHLPSEGVELIIADVPCSGSGTWGRSPEWLRSFNVNDVNAYQQKQIQILENLLPFVRKGGYLLYITCSVFKKENEDVIDSIVQSHAVKVVQQKYLIGYPNRGDQMFATLITL